MRVLLPAGVAGEGARCGVSEEESHHLRVRRAEAGELVELRDGAGLVGTGRLASARGGWEVEVVQARREARPAALTLAVGAGDRDRFAWLVEKAVELGVTRVVPLETERTAGVASRLRAGQIDKLRRVAVEALKQCGAAWACEISEPMSLDRFVAQAPEGARWLADAGGEAAAALDAAPATIVVGPEGGLTPDEMARLGAAGYRSLVLGPFTLRFETAALAAAAFVAAARRRGTHG
ncbi:MAG TPA: RsmE family RNA methyltransferase [Gemmatimonadales bacterium]|nr:RsmE family RNA methyltransferase [Gemmatimonadales bacterium]